MLKTKVRFNLSRGNNYKKWKITYPGGNIEYLDPNEVTLVMNRCKLRNNKKTAERIFNGEAKSVCAWILCEYVVITGRSKDTLEEQQRLRYNPRVKPNWDFKDINVDGKDFKIIESRGNSLYVI
jgi:hypothetical protein